MAEGSCDPNYYLSSLDPGVGKTQTLLQTVKTIVGDVRHRQVGVIIFLSRLEEIRALVNEGGMEPSTYAVLTSDKDLNASGLGHEKANDAQILITTQRRFENATIHGRRFSDCSTFFYRSRPRRVRVWDESLVPGRSITIDRYSIASLLEPLNKSFPLLRQDLETIFDTLKDCLDESFYDVPDFATEHGVGPLEAIATLPHSLDKRAETILSLWFLSGRRVGVRHDRKHRLFIDYRDFLPDDLAPLLILDASGRVRTTYEFWENRRGGLVKLSTGHKRYDNLTIDVWKQTGSKGGWKKEGKKLLEGVASMIQTDPEGEWLIVHHLPKSVGFNLPKELKANPRINPSRLKFLTWGQHLATNAFKDIPNIILAGTLFYPAPAIEALGMAAAKHPSSEGALPKTDRDYVELGEHCHDILQALCRGRARGCVDGVCPPCRAFIIAHPRSGIPNALEMIFPGAKIQQWKLPRHLAETTGSSLKGKAKIAFDFVVTRLKEEQQTIVSFPEAARSVNYDKADFRKIRKHRAFIEALEDEGIRESSVPPGFTITHQTSD
ncbi:hypothetical protein [Dongia sp.]|uniref:hypothetical protein n=1 Tax=Dongia sp. TaxID=1977262 RepID=UPI0034A4500A